MDALKSEIIPLEREFEAWIISNIERYFETNGIKYYIRALMPKEEKKIGADELMFFSNSYKVVALQFKRPYVNIENPTWESLYWNLFNQSNQFTKVAKIPSLYYCLPAFTNRNYRKEALSHCFFWKPNKNEKDGKYYLKQGSDESHSKNNYIKNPMKWVQFIKEILECRIGCKLDSETKLKRKIKINCLLEYFSESENSTKNPSIENDLNYENKDSAIYLIAIEV